MGRIFVEKEEDIPKLKQIMSELDEEEMKSLIYSFEQGQNYIETSYIYAGGQTMKFISEFLKRLHTIFIYVKHGRLARI